MTNLGAGLAGDGKTVVCNYGETALRPGETVEDAASRRYRGWRAGWLYEGYVAPYFWLGREAEDLPIKYQPKSNVGRR